MLGMLLRSLVVLSFWYLMFVRCATYIARKGLLMTVLVAATHPTIFPSYPGWRDMTVI